MTHPYSAWAEQLEGFRVDNDPMSLIVCKIHGDRNPSMSLNLVNGAMRCFGCGWSGFPDQYCTESGETRQHLPKKSTEEWREDKRFADSTITPEATYIYQQPDGATHMRVLRYPGKKFFQQPWKNGQWIKGKGAMDGVPRIPYRLPEIHKSTGLVLWVEGEKDVEAAERLGFVATTSPQGAASFRLLDLASLSILAGRPVCILPDNDPEGAKYARKVARALRAAGALVTQVQLPQKDLSDWVKAGGNRDQLLHLVDQAEEPEESSIEEEPITDAEVGEVPTDILRFHRTDLGNAELLRELYGKDLRYCGALGGWLWWDGRRWLRGEEALVRAGRLANLAARARLQAARAQDDEDSKKHALRSEAAGKRTAALEQLTVLEGMHIGAHEWDSDEWLFGCANGTIDLRTGELHEHDRDQLCTKCSPIAYDPSAKCPTWMQFLNRVMDNRPDNDNQALVDYLQRAVGYALTGSVQEHCFFLFYGVGRNGKSTFIETIQRMMGDYAQRADFETFLTKKNEGPRNDIARLKGARFVAASEANEGRRLDESVIKQLTSEDTLTGRFLYGEFFDFKPSHKLFLAANHKPKIQGTDEGIWSRPHLVPFTVTIPAAERDPRLAAKLSAELPGILAWAIRGCLLWQKEGLRSPDQVRAATQDYRTEMDVLGMFLDEHTVRGNQMRTPCGKLYQAYRLWAEAQGEFILTQVNFTRKLTGRGFEKRRDNKGVWCWIGLGLVAHEADLFSGNGHAEPDAQGDQPYGSQQGRGEVEESFGLPF